MVTQAWTQGDLNITEAVLGAVSQAAEAAYARDEEACGFLQGPADAPLLINQSVELENLANKYHRADPKGHPRTGREYFKINTLKFDQAIAAGAAEGQPVKVFFHSHLDCGAYFSEEDAASMTMGGTEAPAYAIAYLVTAVDKGSVTAHKLFVWDAAKRSFEESPFRVIGKQT